jgi:hypothetical protein
VVKRGGREVRVGWREEGWGGRQDVERRWKVGRGGEGREERKNERRW